METSHNCDPDVIPVFSQKPAFLTVKTEISLSILKNTPAGKINHENA